MKRWLKRSLGRLPAHRWLVPDGRPIVITLMYHDVRMDDEFSNWLRVPVSDFEAQLQSLAAMGSFISPDALTDLRDLPVDRPSFLVTFDDGYRNNAELVAPILERLAIPALFFVSTGPLRSGHPFWSDVVVTAIQMRDLDHLDLSVHGLGEFRFRKPDGARRWDDIQRLMVAIKAVGNEDHPRVARLLDWFHEQFGDELTAQLARYRPLQPDEIVRMHKGGFCHFGSHGHEHRILTRLKDDDLHASLEQSRSYLEDLTGNCIEHLAYPNGDHDARVRTVARKIGYRFGYGIQSGLMSGAVPRMSIPRVAVGGFEDPAMLEFKIQSLMLKLRWSGWRQLELTPE